MRRAVWKTVMQELSARRQVRVPEAGELLAINLTFDRLNRRGIDVTPTWEAAYHNRPKRGTSDGRSRTLARANHVCDRLAGHDAMHGRQNELDFYGSMQPQRKAAHYWTSGGVPILTDPFQRVASIAASVTAQRVLTEETSVTLLF